MLRQFRLTRFDKIATMASCLRPREEERKEAISFHELLLDQRSGEACLQFVRHRESSACRFLALLYLHEDGAGIVRLEFLREDLR